MPDGAPANAPDGTAMDRSTIMAQLLELLHHLSDLGILATVLIVIVGVMMGAPFILRLKKEVKDVAETRDEAAHDAYKAIMSMIGVVLAFSLVQVNGNLRSAETVVGKEAAALSTLDRVLLRMGTPAAAEVRPLVAEYGNSRIVDEWPGLAHGERDARTDNKYNALSKASRALNPNDLRQQSMFNEVLKNLDDIAEQREMLIMDSDVALPNFFWITTTGFLVLAFVLATLTVPTLGRAVGLAAPAAGVALLLAFVIIVDQPFSGQTSVSSAAIQKTLKLNERRE
jgi:hypothetical protein